MSRQDRKKRRMIILSLDAVGGRDLAYMETLPNFGPFFKRAAGCGEVVSVYPSLTYPAHVSIVTGRYPKNHGIVNNLQVQPEREPSDWFWQRKYVQGTTLYDEAVKNSCRVASLLAGDGEGQSALQPAGGASEPSVAESAGRVHDEWDASL